MTGSPEALKLSFHFGERARYRGRFLSEAVLGLCERDGVGAAMLLRGAEGFGAGQRLRADRLLSLSEDLPLVAVAIGDGAAIEALAGELAGLPAEGLLTLERLTAAPAAAGHGGAEEEEGEVKLTVYGGRRARREGLPAHIATVAALHRHGVAGATSLLGVDGVAAGQRLRARFLSANSWVPTVVVAVGQRGRIAAALADLASSEEAPLATLEAVSVRRRDGVASAGTPLEPAPWTRLSLYCSERSEHRGRSLYVELIRRLRAEGAAGATALRGIWGYHGEHRPHGDRLLSLRRRVPVVVEVVDRTERAQRWLELAAEIAEETGLLCVEGVPAARIAGPGGSLEGSIELL